MLPNRKLETEMVMLSFSEASREQPTTSIDGKVRHIEGKSDPERETADAYQTMETTDTERIQDASTVVDLLTKRSFSQHTEPEYTTDPSHIQLIIACLPLALLAANGSPRELIGLYRRKPERGASNKHQQSQHALQTQDLFSQARSSNRLNGRVSKRLSERYNFKDATINSEPGETAVKPRTAKFLSVTIDVRRLIYDYLSLPINQSIHLTHNPENTFFEVVRPTCVVLSKDALALFRSCRQVCKELQDIIYGTNTFVLMPGAQNYKLASMPALHSNTDIWLSLMRSTTCQTVRFLRVFLGLSSQAQYNLLVKGLKDFPFLEIIVQPLATTKLTARSRLGRLCKEIEKVRPDTSRTVWNHGGSPEIASILEASLRPGFELI